MYSPLESFSAPVREWFAAALGAPTPAQAQAWESIAAGEHTLVVAPTGSGKTLAAFLWAIDQLYREPRADQDNDDPSASQGRAFGASGGPTTSVLYVSPLKALAEDVRRNLQAPLAGIADAARRMGQEPPELTVGLRSGDTSPAGRRELLRRPPDILITTPESLFLMLTSRARDTLTAVRTVVVDEVHDVVGTKRGAHLALSLARLDSLLAGPAQRIGLSATVRPHDEVARFLTGGGRARIVAPSATKRWDVSVRAPMSDMSATDEEVAASGRNSVWPQVERAVLEVVLAARSCIVFVNSRTVAERFVAALNERYVELLDGAAGAQANGAVPGGMPAQIASTTHTSDGAPALLAKAHHGSVSKAARALVEADLKAGLLRCVVATSSLELGIDMGSVDVVVQLGAPPSAASGLQRVGRAGHQVGATSVGVLFPLHRLDVAHCAVVAARMRAGQIEELRVLGNPLDVLAQHTVSAAVAGGEAGLGVDEWFDLLRKTAPFTDLPRAAYESVLDLLSGKYPSDVFGELRPRLVWDRAANTLTARPGAALLAATSGGTIPDRGLYGVFLAGETSSRVGELDEEMVYESRAGDVIQLGAASWRIVEITHDRVLVVPAPGLPARLSFWKGDGPGRPAELGRAVGRFLRQWHSLAEPEALDENAVLNLTSLLAEQRASGSAVPTDAVLVVERFRDPLGDWQVALLSPYGAAVHAPWALAVAARIRERHGVAESPAVSDDGIVVRVPDGDGAPPGAELFLFDPEEVERIVRAEVGGSALFAARFRECAARALLLPRRKPGQRTALWLQRLRSAQLLDVVWEHPRFPILLETMRECLQDVYDLRSLTQLLAELERGEVRVVEALTPAPSPFARSLLFGYDGLHMYEDDRPLAERRAAALQVDEHLLAELLGKHAARDLLDPDVVARTALELQRLDPRRRARGVEGVADLLRELGPLTEAEVSERTQDDGASALAALRALGRAVRFERAGRQWWAVVEDTSRLRDALGVVPPSWPCSASTAGGLPAALLAPVLDPLGDLVSRYARTHGPFTTAAVAERFGLGVAVANEALRRLEAAGRVRSGEFVADLAESQWCAADVLRRLRRGSLAALRAQIEPVSPAAFARFLLSWQHVAGPLSGVDGLLEVLDQLAGARVPLAALETLVLPARVSDYAPALLDEALAAGEAYWTGAGPGWVRLYPADLAPRGEDGAAPSELGQAVLRALASGGAFFPAQIASAVAAEGSAATEAEVQDELRALMWSGRVTADSFAPPRAWLAPARMRAAPARLRRPSPLTMARPGLSGAAGRAVGGGRWALVPDQERDPTVRTAQTAQLLLGRYGVLTRDAVAAEEVPGGFAAVYQVLSMMESAVMGDGGTCRRGYFVDSLGGAQFALGSTVDLLREHVRPAPRPLAVALAATDPANPYGAVLRWPEHPSGGRPGRRPGALVVLVDGELAFTLERGGASLLAFLSADDALTAAAEALAKAVRQMGRIVVGRLDGASVHGAQGAVVDALRAAGFVMTPGGLRLR